MAASTGAVLGPAPLRAQAVRPGSGQPLTPLRIGIAASDGVTAVVYAAKAGLFERAGLQVDLQKQTNGAAVAAAVAGGVVDIGNSSLTSIFLAHERGIPFVFVAAAGLYDEKQMTTGALLLKDSPLQLGKDANGTVVGLVSLSGTGHDAMCGWVDQHGGDSSTLKFIEVPFSLEGPALQQHRCVATETATPAMTAFLDTGDFRVIPVYSAIGPLFLVSAWFTTRDFTAKHPDVVRTFARVVSESARYCNAHHADSAAIMASFIGLQVATVEHMPRTPLGPTLEAAQIQPVIAAAAKYGTLKKAFPAQEVIWSGS